MVQPVFEGSLVALVTPMSSDGSIDFDNLKSLVEWHISQKTDGLVIMGTTGESALVSDQELFDVVEAVIQQVDIRLPVIVGCGGAATRKTVKLAKRISRLGPSALLCVTPYYVKPEQSGLIEHYVAVADATNVPVILYNIPGRTGCDLANESVIKLSSHKNIIGLKDGTAQIDRVEFLRKHTPKGFGFWSGDDETALDYVIQGGNGVISVTANVTPLKMHQWIELVKQGEISQASQLFDQLLDLHKTLFIESSPIPVKWALHLMNRIGVGIREPLEVPSEVSKKRIKDALQDIGLV